MAEDLMHGAAVRAAEAGEVLHHPEHGNVHHLRHTDGLFHDHGDELLRRGHDDDAVDRKRLKYRQRHIAGARRHIHEQEIHVAPDHIRPELLDNVCDHRPAPHDRVVAVLKQKIDGHHADAGSGPGRVQRFAVALRAAMQAKRLGDGGAGHIRIEDADAFAAAACLYRKRGRYEGFAHAALAAHNGDDVLHVGLRIAALLHALRRGARGTVRTAARAVMAACLFAHRWFLLAGFILRVG